MKQFREKDFKLVILICPTTPEVESDAYEQVLRIVRRAQLNAETYLLTAGDLREIAAILSNAGLNDRGVQLLSLFGYSNVCNTCLLAASILTADAALLIDDDEVFELPDFVPRSLEFLGRRVYGDIVHGVAGYYLNGKGQYYDDVTPEPWMTYWDRFGCKARAFDQIIGSGPRLKRTPFAFGGAMILRRELFECVPFDPLVTRGEDVDYLINSRMFGFSFFLDNTLSINCRSLSPTPSGSVCGRTFTVLYISAPKCSLSTKQGILSMSVRRTLTPIPGNFSSRIWTRRSIEAA